jgi:hypothetical protein
MKKCEMCSNEVANFNSVTCSNACKVALKDRRLVERQLNRDNQLREQVGEVEYNKLPECKICHIRSNDLTAHIAKFHKMPLNDYKLKYGNYIRSEKYMLEASERCRGDKNPVHKIEDKRSISPYSYLFYMKKGFDEVTSKQMALEKAREVQAAKTDEQQPTKLAYWLKKTDGNVEEAKKLFKERQTTFSKEKCIEQHGESKGMEIWSKRQEKWQSTLNDKSDEEKLRITKAKMHNKSYSKISQELFIEVYNRLNNKFKCRFAILKRDGRLEDDGINDEYYVMTANGIRFLDFYIPELKKCLEFFGTYYHSEKFRKGNKIRDAIRDQEIKDTVDGIQILYINEHEYRKDKEATIKKCLEFING